jgi:hypothetical protein
MSERKMVSLHYLFDKVSKDQPVTMHLAFTRASNPAWPRYSPIQAR